MNLKAYLADIGMSLKDFGLLLDYNPAYISAIAKGKMLPSRRLASEIEKVTDGLIKVEASPKRDLREEKRRAKRAQLWAP